MKVILLENLPSIGNLGEVINVSTGYARNYLFPQGKAERASEDAIKKFEARRADLQQRQEAVEAALAKAHQALEGYTLQLATRASPDGNLYGSITPQMIVNALNQQPLLDGLAIKRTQIALPDGQIKSLGEHNAIVRLGPAVTARIKISVLTETAAASQSTTQETPHASTDKDTQ